MKIKFMSKHEAQKIKPDSNMAMISIRSPAEMVDLHPKWLHVLPLEFHDSDPSEKEPFEPVYFNETHAKEIIDFYESLPSEVEYLYVHCYAGISRSAAVAIAISHLYEWQTDFENYDLYNRHVYRILMNYGEGRLGYVPYGDLEGSPINEL